MTFGLTIAGVSKQLKAGSLRISQTANGRTTASFDILSVNASYRAAYDAEVLITENGTRILGGLIDRPHERGLFGGQKRAITTSVNVVDFAAYAERRYVNETIPAGSLKAALIRVTTYLAAYGVTLDGAQVTGPSLPDLTYDYKRVDEVLNELATLTASVGEPFVWQIDAFKVLRMYQPSTVPAPFDLSGDYLPKVIGDIEVEVQPGDYANKVIVRVAPTSEVNRVETFTEGVDSYPYTLQFTLTAGRGYVTHDGIYETLTTTDFPGTASWEYDPVVNTLTRVVGAPSGGAVTSVTFDGTFTATGTATDPSYATNPWEKVIAIDTVPSNTTAQAIADAELAKHLTPTKLVTYTTWQSGIAPGQSQSMTIPARNLSGVSAVITDVTIRDLVNRVEREVTAVIDAAQTNLGRGWRDTYKAWLGDKTGGSTAAAVSVGSGTVVQVGPGGPTTAVQFNRDGVFGGDGDFTYLEAANSLICGGGGSSITAADHESCQVFGYDNHIADP